MQNPSFKFAALKVKASQLNPINAKIYSISKYKPIGYVVLVDQINDSISAKFDAVVQLSMKMKMSLKFMTI